jgi:hypothetical protein
MGTSTNVGEFAGKIHRAGRSIQGAQRAGVAEAALVGKGIFLANMGATRMSNVGRGARLGARFDIKGVQAPTAILYYTGPAHLLNNPTKAHEIAPRSSQRTAGGRRRRGTAKALTAGSGVYAKVQHPGTAGKKFFERSVPQVAAAHRNAQQRAVRKALTSAF